jgi:hypothetical protein
VLNLIVVFGSFTKMHILKIIHGYPPQYNAGSEVYSHSICNELSKTHKVSVFTREENSYRPDFAIRRVSEHPNLDFYYVNNPQGKDGYRHQLLDEPNSTMKCNTAVKIPRWGF